MGNITKRTAIGRTRHENFSLDLDIGSHINAAAQPSPEAGAERTLEGVGCSRLFGAETDRDSAQGFFAFSLSEPGEADSNPDFPSYTDSS
jgi:hypothetical protein